jgi:peptide chain release factor 1
LKISGKKAKQIFEGEAGGHRWQRVPPTEKRGRVHTSTITVAVLPAPKKQEVHIDSRDIKETFTCGSGPGGQHRNKNATAVQLVHLPTGITVRAESEKSQFANRENALSILRAKLLQSKKNKYYADREKDRREQVGSGMRGDKIRTIQVRNNTVVDHKTGKKITYKEYAKGKIDGLKK